MYQQSAEMDMDYEELAPAPHKKMKRGSFKQSNGQSDVQENNTQSMARKIHYNGYASLRVARIEESIQDIQALATKYKGGLENRGKSYITIRVPKEKFKEAFAKILSLGEVVSKSITAEDLSQAHQSTSLRLQTAKSTRDRLLELLNKTQDEKEKIALLKEIQRLNEQIDTMETQLRTLDTLSRMSKITVELQPRQRQTTSNQIEPFGFSWIHSLSPFQSQVAKSGKRHVIPVPKGMVLLSKKGWFRAQAADGAVIRSATLRNQPEGSASFWQDAVLQRLSSGFAQAETSDLGAYKAVSFLSDSEIPYTYIVAIKTEKKKLHLVEIYYPTQIQKERYQANVLEALGGK